MTRGENILFKKWVQSDLHIPTDWFYFSGTETNPAGPGAISIVSVPTLDTQRSQHVIDEYESSLDQYRQQHSNHTRDHRPISRSLVVRGSHSV
jgi:hypothetical protein